MTLSASVALGAAVAVLVVVNVLNNRFLPHRYVLTCVAGSVALMGILALAVPSWSDALEAAGLGPGHLRPGALLGAAMVAGVAVCYAGGMTLPATRRLFLDRRVQSFDRRVVVHQAVVRVPLGTVLLEEVAFRGVIYALAAIQWGLVWATVVSASLFGLWHILPSIGIGTVNPVVARVFGTSRAGAVAGVACAVLACAVAGVFFCELRRHSGSLLAPAALHWATNGLGYLAAFAVIGRLKPVPGVCRAGESVSSPTDRSLRPSP